MPASSPTSGTDDIVINHDVTLNGTLDVKANTTITVKACVTLHITGDVIFDNNSIILVEPCATLIIDGNVTNNNNSNQITIDGTIIIGGNYNGGNGSAVIGTGSMNITGSVTTDGSATVFGSGVDCVSNCSSSASNPLPITLLNFKCSYKNNHVYLEWATSSEINNDYFIIERSQDGIFYEDILRILGAGNSNQLIEYSSIDFNPLIGASYYRLKQVDFDGNYSTSYPISIIIDHINKEPIYTIDLVGRTVPDNYNGFRIEVYEDGRTVFISPKIYMGE